MTSPPTRLPATAGHGPPAAVSPALVDVVIPTVGRPSLSVLLDALAADRDVPLASVTVVDDRGDAGRDRPAPVLRGLPGRVLASGGRGPAAARNLGWRAGQAPWVVFLDDDVVPGTGWGAALAADLAAAEARTGAVRGRIEVPLPADRRPTDWERQVHGLSTASGWLTADLAVRRELLDQVGGLDERFPAAFREDTDLQLRATAAGWATATGRRTTTHPVGPADRWVSVRRQRGNADDVLMDRVHGPGWRPLVGEVRGAFRHHAATVAAGAAALLALAARRRRLAVPAAVGWAAGTGRFAWRRIAPGPRDPAEVATMVATSIVIPPAAVYHRLAGWRRWRRVSH